MAGTPAEFARCVTERTHHLCRWVCAGSQPSPGGAYPSEPDLLVNTNSIEDALAEADLLFVHDGKVDPRHFDLLSNKAVITIAHGRSLNVDMQFVSRGLPGGVVGDGSAICEGFRNWPIVPTPVPIWDDDYKPQGKSDTITVCYTPATQDEPSYATTLKALDWLAAKHGVHLETRGAGLISHAESLAMKRRSHIVVDDCATGSYSRDSLDGLAAGCVVVNGVGLLAGVPEVFKLCANFATSVPFEFSEIKQLGGVLESLVLAGAAKLESEGRRNRKWTERYWNFEEQWANYWVPLARAALG